MVSNVNYQVVSANEWLFSDSEVSGDGACIISLIAARGSRIGCQILVNHVPNPSEIRWSYRSKTATSDLQAEVYQMIDVLVNENTGPDVSTVPLGTPADYATRLAPFRVYDALQPVGPAYPSRSTTEALYVSWDIPIAMTPGDYAGVFELWVGETSFTIPVSIQVVHATVPEQAALATTNWMSIQNVAKRHQLEMWSEPFWAMVRKYGEAMRRAKQTHFLVGLEFIQVQAGADGQYTFDFSRAERLIRMFLALGFTGIEGGHVAGRTDWNAPNFVLSYDNKIDATGTEGFAFLAQFLPAWHQFLSMNGWLTITIQHIADEPIEESAADFRILSGIVRKFMPGVPLIEAMIYPAIEGSMDIWVPTNEGFDKHREHFERMQQLGDTVWFYTCWNPGGNYLNRFMDLHLLKTRYLHWGNYKYGLTGYLHWGFNQYLGEQDPYELTCPFLAPSVHSRRVPAGDTHIVYPGADGPLLSMRLEAMRAGIEDYELFQQLAAYDRDAADEILSTCMTSFTNVNTDMNVFDEAYRRLLMSLSAYAQQTSIVEESI
ncbi:DUF4091 domain-containing protein [Paenibacillus guangzhouensis]|uniref:DUF4091 domain-containing protein n=1 Tax=Paenibacillus guangzhouensis TaxID=1473112 RepID=UPI0012677BC2|nr:DUF4091 domain-containing protein [Paenibacillus guangzhouensis]